MELLLLVGAFFVIAVGVQWYCHQRDWDEAHAAEYVGAAAAHALPDMQARPLRRISYDAAYDAEVPNE